MNFVVVGLGSMGKRRIRCLKALNFDNVVGFDLRDDRRKEVEEKYGIKAFSDFEEALGETKPDALIISVPPQVHHEYMKDAVRNRISFFVEASVVDTDMDLIKEELKKTTIVAAPSATLLFHPAVTKIGEILEAGTLGKISNLIHHSGQYLPDWHPYEGVSDYYVSNPATGGAREIVPFELTWLTGLFGFPKKVCGNVRKTVTIAGAEMIDDTYNFLMDYEDFLMSISVDVVSRYATRRLLINGDRRQLVWDWNTNNIRVFDPEKGNWDEFSYEMAPAEAGYNPNIGENMYIEELKCFIEAVQGRRPFRNTMENDHKVLRLLEAVEQSEKSSQFVAFDQ
ncbi:Gfo/Idh/MocA family protein [Planctomycetota bacterium]